MNPSLAGFLKGVLFAFATDINFNPTASRATFGAGSASSPLCYVSSDLFVQSVKRDWSQPGDQFNLTGYVFM